ncbi:MAG: hypothetical protein Q9160_008909 [Pyrenula sp. 1 TL-2023]
MIFEQLLIKYPRFAELDASAERSLTEQSDNETCETDESEMDEKDVKDEGFDVFDVSFDSEYENCIEEDVGEDEEEDDDGSHYLIKLLYPPQRLNLGALLRTDLLTRTAINVTKCSAGVLRTCRAFYNEGNHLLYETNVFDLTACFQDWILNPYQKDLISFPNRIGLHNFGLIQHLDIEMHYLLKNLKHAGMLFRVMDGFSHTGIKAKEDEIEYYLAQPVAPRDERREDPLTALLMMGTKDHDTFIDFLIYHMKDSLAPSTKPSTPKAYTMTERGDQSLLLTNDSMPAKMALGRKEIDVPELQRRLETEEKEIKALKKPLAARARKFEREQRRAMAHLAKFPFQDFDDDDDRLSSDDSD